VSTKAFIVCLDEIRQNFVSGEPFVGSYTKTVNMSDGSTRTVTLTPMVRDGTELVELNDTGHVSYMGLHSTTTNGALMVQICETPEDPREHMEARKAGKSDLALASPVLPPETSLLSLPGFVPAGFTEGIEIFNDNTTPMEFVITVLSTSLGLSRPDSTGMMLRIHRCGGALIPLPSLSDARRVAAQITAEATSRGYPLLCRPVSVGRIKADSEP
jgi:ATP-dependent Clp protease adapter protein ClpS